MPNPWFRPEEVDATEPKGGQGVVSVAVGRAIGVVKQDQTGVREVLGGESAAGVAGQSVYDNHIEPFLVVYQWREVGVVRLAIGVGSEGVFHE